MTSMLVMRSLGLLLTAASSLAFYIAAWRNPIWTKSMDAYRRRLDASFVFLRMRPIGSKVLSVQLMACTTLCVASFTSESMWPAALAAALAFLPASRLARAHVLRREHLDAQLDSWLVALANALRGTPSLGDALASTTPLLAAPLREEIDHVLKETQLGVPLDDALDSASERISSRAFSAAMLTLRIARTSGGSVSECLESSAAALREMIRLDGVLRSKTADGKGQALVIALLPLPFFGVLYWIDPSFLLPLTLSTLGQLLLCAAGMLWLAGVMIARRVVQVDL